MKYALRLQYVNSPSEAENCLVDMLHEIDMLRERVEKQENVERYEYILYEIEKILEAGGY